MSTNRNALVMKAPHVFPTGSLTNSQRRPGPLARRAAFFIGLWILAVPALLLAQQTPGVFLIGEASVSESTADIMARQAFNDSIGLTTDHINKEENSGNRRGLPQLPGALEISRWPIPTQEQLDAEKEDESGGQARAPQAIGLNFIGPTLTDTGAFPPDTMGAVGPTQFIVHVNGRIRSYSKFTGVADTVLNATTNTFFNSVRNMQGTSDPRIRFDRLSNRWYAVIINVANTSNRILIGTSDTAIITAATVWTFTFLTNNNPTAQFLDYPTLGIDRHALYIGGNNFTSSVGSFQGTRAWVVRKSSVLGGGGPIVATFFNNLAVGAGVGMWTPQGVDNFDPASNEGYFIGPDNSVFSRLILRRVTDPGGTPTISGDVFLTVPTTAFPTNPTNLGGATVDALDDRLFAAAIRNGRLWTAHNITTNASGVGAAGGGRTAARWYEIQVPPTTGALTLIQSGTVFDPAASNPRTYFIPSIMVSGQGHAALGTSTAGAADRLNAFTTGRLATDTLGTTQNSGVPASSPTYTASTTGYNAGGGRWGDYSYTCLDPLDDMTLWTVQQYCQATNSYALRIARLDAPAPTLNNPADSGSQGQVGKVVNLTGTGFYDPGPDPAAPHTPFNHLNVTFPGGAVNGITVTNIAFNSPTSVAVTINISGAATPGTRNITLTNPDGQNITVTNGFTVLGGSFPNCSGITRLDPSPTNLAVVNFTVTFDQSVGGVDNTDFALATTGVAGASIGATTGGPASYNVSVNTGTGDGTIGLNLVDNDSITATVGGAPLGGPGAGNGNVTGQVYQILKTGSITIDDPAAITEGNSGTTNITFTVSVSPMVPGGFTVNYVAGGGTATSGVDYTATSGMLTFLGTDSSKQIMVPVIGDTALEANETFTVTLSGNTGMTVIADAQGSSGILNDDHPSRAYCVNTEANPPSDLEGFGAFDPTALASSFLYYPSATFAAAVNSAPTTFWVSGDFMGTDRTVFYTMTRLIGTAGGTLRRINTATGAVISTTTITGTIATNNVNESPTGMKWDPVGNQMIVLTTDTFGAAGARSSALHVLNLATGGSTLIRTLTGTPGGTGGTAANPTFVAWGLAIPQTGTTYHSVHVQETGGIGGAPPTNANQFYNISNTVGGGWTLVGTILGTNSAQFPSDLDYDPLSGTLYWTGYASTFASDLYTINPATGAGTLVGNFDVLIPSPGYASISGIGFPQVLAGTQQISINDVASAAEGNAGTVNRVFTVSLAAPNPGPADVTADVTFGGTAALGSDFTATGAGAQTWTTGQQNKTVTVTVNGDTTFEVNELLTVNVSNPSANAVIVDGSGVTTLNNDDAAALAPGNVFAVDIGTDGLVTFDPNSVAGTLSRSLDAAYTNIHVGGDFQGATTTAFFTIDWTAAPNQLISINTTTNARTVIGNVTGLPANHLVTGMCWDGQSGVMRVLTWNNTLLGSGAGQLHTINLASGALTNGATITGGLGNVPLGIACRASDGQVFVVDVHDTSASDRLLAVNKATGASTIVGTTLGVDMAGLFFNDLDFNDNTNTLYWATLDPLQNERLYSIDTTSGVATELADLEALGIVQIGAMAIVPGGVLGPMVTNVTSPTANGTYTVPTVIPIQVTFDASVTVTGTPQLLLETGAVDRQAVYTSGSPGTVLTFNYTIQAGDNTPDLNYQSTAALTLNGGTINATVGGAPAVLTLPGLAAAGSLGTNKNIVIDAVAPTVQTVTAINSRTIDVTFNEPMGAGVTTAANYTISGAGRGTLANNPNTAVLQAGNTYRLTWNLPQEMFGGGAVTITVAAVQDAVGNALGAPNAGNTTGIGINPTVMNVMAITSQVVDVTFDEAMTGAGVTTAGSYTISGSGQGTLAANPTTAVLQVGNTYRLTWAAGSMTFGGDVTITVSTAATDLALNPVVPPGNTATHVGGGIPVEITTLSTE